MAQHEAKRVESYNTTSGDRVYRWDVNGTYGVAFIYADQSPQFIACDTQAEADALFVASQERADKRGELREVEEFTADA
ncbi:hypothetical protein CPT_Shady_055 [Streptomyces phage Shady]|uniref:Uncharacterized protein n=1 Tax=Streptomyces phage Shady TaxID=2767585 RepID=A0A873WJZ1_9CAUD|nr:hypothetical protein CPT_Shady_055 [Streptomyces phage Shady]